MVANNHIEVWERCLQIIKSNVPDAVFQKWFVPVKPVSLEGSTLTIEVPSDAHMVKLEEEPLIDIMAKTLKRVIGDSVRLVYTIRFPKQQFPTITRQTSRPPTSPYLFH